VSFVSTLGVRHWQRWGSKHSVKHKGLSSTISHVWGITGMDKLVEVSLLRIVKSAELELPFGSRAKMAISVWLGEF